MKVDAPCRLGERFEHDKTWGERGPLYFVGLALFVWHDPGMGGVEVMGSRLPYIDHNAGVFRTDYFAAAISLAVPDRLLCGGSGVCLRELGLDSERRGWLSGVYLDEHGGPFYSISFGDGPFQRVRTETLDKLFAPILPAVRLSAADFL